MKPTLSAWLCQRECTVWARPCARAMTPSVIATLPLIWRAPRCGAALRLLEINSGRAGARPSSEPLRSRCNVQTWYAVPGRSEWLSLAPSPALAEFLTDTGAAP